MDLSKLIKDKVVYPSVSHRFTTTRGDILDLDYNNNTAKIEIPNQFGQGTFELEEVPINLTGNGVVVNNLSIGDKVIVDFVGGSLSAARITGLSYSNYNIVKLNNKHIVQDLLVTNEVTEIKSTMTQEELLFDNAEDINDYLKQIDLDKEYYDFVNSIGQYQEGDIGITNPYTKSTIILKKDGSVTISTSKDSSVTLDKDGYIYLNAKGVYINSINDITFEASKDINFKCNKINKIERG